MLVVLILCIFFGLSGSDQVWAQTQSAEMSTLHFSVAEWAYEVRDQGDYDPNPTGTFFRGERGYAYLEIEGFGVGQKDNLFYLVLDGGCGIGNKERLQALFPARCLGVGGMVFRRAHHHMVLHLGGHSLVGTERHL
jgi:hypothetical protein